MEDHEFNDVVDNIFVSIEDGVDDIDADIDVDSSNGILTITFPSGTSAIFSRQQATHEIWVAARSGGFHLHHEQGEWHCANTHESLATLVNRVFSEQLGAETRLLDD